MLPLSAFAADTNPPSYTLSYYNYVKLHALSSPVRVLATNYATANKSRIYEPLTIADICQHFSLSRSSLQILFKTAVKQTPKKYISDLKLEKACQMLQENRYTISEISLRLGYSSIHYFSNAFNRKYEVSPSEYAKRFYQQPGNTAR